MIEPIKTTIQQGNSRANISIEQNGFRVKFENPTPSFQENVAKMIDTFIWSEEPKTLDEFKIDTFVKEEQK